MHRNSIFSPLIEHAIELAAQWHDQTHRKSRWRDPAFEIPEEETLRVPVVSHVTNVAMIVQRAGWDDATIAAAYLHDIIEDGNRYGRTLRYEELCALMGREVADRVLEVTEDRCDEDGRPLPWRARKERYVARLHTASDEAVAISLADKLHNLWCINETLLGGIDVFTSGPDHRALSAGPGAQRWFYRAVLDASRTHTDPRLVPLRDRMEQELERFEATTARSAADAPQDAPNGVRSGQMGNGLFRRHG